MINYFIRQKYPVLANPFCGNCLYRGCTCLILPIAAVLPLCWKGGIFLVCPIHNCGLLLCLVTTFHRRSAARHPCAATALYLRASLCGPCACQLHATATFHVARCCCLGTATKANVLVVCAGHRCSLRPRRLLRTQHPCTAPAHDSAGHRARAPPTTMISAVLVSMSSRSRA